MLLCVNNTKSKWFCFSWSHIYATQPMPLWGCRTFWKQQTCWALEIVVVLSTKCNKISFWGNTGNYSQTKCRTPRRHGRWLQRAGWLCLEVSLGRWWDTERYCPALPYNPVGGLRWGDRAKAIGPTHHRAWLKTHTVRKHKYMSIDAQTGGCKWTQTCTKTKMQTHKHTGKCTDQMHKWPQLLTNIQIYISCYTSACYKQTAIMYNYNNIQ